MDVIRMSQGQQTAAAGRTLPIIGPSPSWSADLDGLEGGSSSDLHGGFSSGR